MPDTVDRRELGEIPDEATIASFREEAEKKDVSIDATFSTEAGTEKRLVVSPRGTVVLLNDVSEETFNRSTPADEIADYLRE